MAKKKHNLSPEELLEQALVTESEWPYVVPENWVWTRLFSCIDVCKEKLDEFDDDELKYIGLEHIGSGEGIIGFDSATQLKSLKNVFNKGQILYGKLRPYLNKHDIASFNGVCSTDILVLDTKETTIEKFMNYLLDTSELIEYAVNNSKGINLPRVSEGELLSFPTPLPPLAEQQRIVDRIESLFEKLDQAKGLIQDALDSFENRKAAILHRAFSGELTKKWREENGVGMESWEDTELGVQVSKLGDGLHGTPIYSEDGEFYFINGNNFNRTYIEIKADTKKVDLEEFMKYRKNIGENTVFVSINGTLGKTAFYNGEPVILGKSACYFNVGEKLDKRFIRYYMETKEFLNYASTMATGSTIKNLSLKAMRTLPLSLPTIEEQVEIINVLDGIIENELKSYELIALNHELDLMKKSILSRAFRGELGTNDQDEESSLALLTEVLNNG